MIIRKYSAAEYAESAKLLRNHTASDSRTMYAADPDEFKAWCEERELTADNISYKDIDAAGIRYRSFSLENSCLVAVRTDGGSILELYALLSSITEFNLKNRLRFAEACNKNFSMRDIIACCADTVDGSAIFIGKDFSISYFAGSSHIESPFAKDLLSGGKIREESVKECLKTLQGSEIAVLDPDDNDVCRMIKVSLDQTEHFYILMFSGKDLDDESAGSVFGMMRESFSAINRKRLSSGPAAGDFGGFIQAVVNGDLKTWDEIDAYAKRLPVPPKRYINIAIVQVNNTYGRTSLDGFAARIKALFPGSEAAVLEKDIVLMISHPTRTFQPRPKFDTEQMKALLAEYDSYIAFSNATQRMDMIRTNYVLAESTLRLGKALRERSTDRIFYYEDYAEYISIEMSLERFSSLMGHDDILFLTNPDAVTIYRYDQLHGTDLQLVLYYFCKNNGSISAAANDSFMHRNTFSARLAEIRKILKHVDLDDEALQHRMLFSCKVFRYYNLYYDKKASRTLSQRLSLTNN